MRLALVCAAAALVLTNAPLALAGEPTPAATEAGAKPPKPKRICRQGPANSTGRIGTGRVCKTADEWAEIDAGGGLRGNGTRAVTSGSAETN
jgi:hypothetical protein